MPAEPPDWIYGTDPEGGSCQQTAAVLIGHVTEYSVYLAYLVQAVL